MRAETWSALFQLVGVVGGLGAFGWARMPLVAARLRLRSTVDLEIENISRATARRVTVELSSAEPFSGPGRTPIDGVWKWGLADIGSGQRYSCYGVDQKHLTSGFSVTVRWKGSLNIPRRRSYNFGGPELQDGAVLMSRSAVETSGVTQNPDTKAIVRAIRDHTRAVIDYSD